MMVKKAVYKRVVLKLSGEALQGAHRHGIDQKILFSIAQQIKEIRELSLEIAVVLGGETSSGARRMWRPRAWIWIVLWRIIWECWLR